MKFKWLRIITVAVDAAIFYTCVYCALRIKFDFLKSTFEITVENLAAINSMLPFICVIGVVLIYFCGLYSIPDKSLFDVIYDVGIVVALMAVVTMALSFLTRSFAFPRLVIAINAVLQLAALMVWHVLAYKLGQVLYGKQTVLVIGHNPELMATAHKILQTPGGLYEIKFLFDLDKDFKIARKLIPQVDHVFLCSNTNHKERQKIFQYCIAENASLFMLPELFDISVKNARLQPFDDTLAFRIGRMKFTMEQKFVKRVFDIFFSLVVIIITSPLMLAAALLVKLTTPGKVFYRQERITENNRVFQIVKFRTMYENAEKRTGPVLTAENDPRITPFGRLMRSVRLDELPQFFNVLMGDMSVVGPRPERLFFINRFKNEMPDYEYRTSVKAGITGYAQVMGKYTTSYSDKLRYDLFYIKNYSFWLDMTLIMQTIRVMFKKDMARGMKKKTNGNAFKEALEKTGYRLCSRDGYWETEREMNVTGRSVRAQVNSERQTTTT